MNRGREEGREHKNGGLRAGSEGWVGGRYTHVYSM